jgi:hypothetical protein
MGFAEVMRAAAPKSKIRDATDRRNMVFGVSMQHQGLCAAFKGALHTQVIMMKAQFCFINDKKRVKFYLNSLIDPQQNNTQQRTHRGEHLYGAEPLLENKVPSSGMQCARASQIF